MSAKDNLEELCKMEDSPLVILYGIKVLMMTGIVFGHSVENTLTGAVFNMRSVELVINLNLVIQQNLVIIEITKNKV